MIKFIKGEIIEIEKDHIIIATTNLGFKVYISSEKKWQLNKNTLVYTEWVFKDGYIIYGFLTNTEKELFKNLLKISGIGPKTALKVVANGEDLSLEKITSISGIGPKTADTIVTKFAKKDCGKQKEIVKLLVNLGYERNKIIDIYSKIDTTREIDKIVQEILKYA